MAQFPQPTAIERRIVFVRGEKALLDIDLAELYGVETRILNQAVRRNAERFPPDFMFQLTTEEVENLRAELGASNQAMVARSSGAAVAVTCRTSSRSRASRCCQAS